jgi:xylan 1,4-beta-xylosidase
MDRPTIRNPILPGFNADPSICRAGDDYYIAVSTFEWYPGVQIHHSRDLVNWRLATRPLNRAAQLDMRGNPDSCGVWAPCLTHADGLFWLIYTDVKRKSGSFKDAHNYLVTAPSIESPWSDPVYLNSSGFDPSLFHDDDGRKWHVNLVWDHRGRPSRFGGIVLQEYDHEKKKLVGPINTIFSGSPLGLTEGPHLYKRGGWYYLIVAEGGTGYSHAVTMARSRELLGPYELHPDTHVLTSKFHPDATLQRGGHGDFVETPDGSVYMVHLCSRPLPGLYRSVLGRETAIQKCSWGNDGWLRLEGEKFVPKETVDAPNLPAYLFSAEPEICDFAAALELPDVFQWLRTPYPERLFSLKERPGYLRLFGRESIGSWYEQALVARRQTAFDYDAETQVEASPASHLQMAGLIAYYNRFAYHYLSLTWDEKLGRCLQIFYCNGQWPNGMTMLGLDVPIPVPAGPVRMRVEVRGAALRFFYEKDGRWTRIGPVLDNSVLSDESGEGEQSKITGTFVGIGNFTGAFVGMAAHDVGGLGMPADFSHFKYKNLPSE